MSTEEKQRDKLIYEIVMNRYNQEWKRTNNLDSKASNVTGFAGLLATLTAGATELFPQTNYSLLFLIPLGFLILSAVLGLLAYWIKNYSAIAPDSFINKYHNKTETQILRAYTASISKNTVVNNEINDKKVKIIKTAFAFLVFSIVLFLVLSIINLILT
jgi:hypothetical protein